MRNKNFKHPARESGSTLLIAVVLLLLAGVMAVLAMNVGIFEQRSSANDVRAKSVHEVAEAGLAQGAEYLLRQHPEMFATHPELSTSTWTPCTTEVTFPCDSISTAVVDIDGDPATPASATRKSTMYRLTNSGATIASLDSALVSRMLDMTQTIISVGSGSTVAYGVAPVVCFVAKRNVKELADSPIRCATTAAEATDRRIVTFVSVAAIPGESARTTLTQTVGRYPLLDTPTGKPPIIASGSANVTGGLQIVTNPNAGGSGVPVSVWSRKDVTKSGTPNTCYADEFYRYLSGSVTPSFEGTGTRRTIVCDDCKCETNGAPETLSYDKSGNKQAEGIDILDVEGGSTTAFTDPLHQGINYNVRSDADSYSLCEFPPDLFAHLFSVKAWEDLNNDCFAETKIMKDYTNPNNGDQIVNIGADEAFLYENAVKIINPASQTITAKNGTSVTAAGLRAPSQLYTGTYTYPNGSYPSDALSGLVWCQSSCDIGSNRALGSVDRPVVIVVDIYNTSQTSAAAALQIQGKVYGIVFVRSRHPDGPLTVPNSNGSRYTIQAYAGMGGNGLVKMNSGSVIYGSLVVQGMVSQANGSAAVVYNEQVLQALSQDPNNSRFATLPGAWNDRSTY